MKKLKSLLCAILVSASGAAMSTSYESLYNPYTYTDASGNQRTGCDYTTWVENGWYHYLPRLADGESTYAGSASIYCSGGTVSTVIFHGQPYGYFMDTY